MTFANEVKDFMAGYQMITEMNENKKQREQDKAYKDALLEIQKGEFELKKQQFDLDKAAGTARARIGGGGAGGASALPTKEDGQPDYDAVDHVALVGAGTNGRAVSKEIKERQAAADRRDAEEAVSVAPTPENFDLSEIPDGDYKQVFAGGGIVEDEAPAAAPQTAIPATSPATPKLGFPEPAPTTAPAAAQAEAPPPEQPALPPAKSTRIVVQRAADVGKQIMDTVEYELRTPQAAIGEGADRTGINWLTNEGAMEPEEIEAIERTVDPENKVAPHLKTAVTMNETFRYWSERGDPAKALRASMGYLTGQKGITQTLGALSLEAAEQGDPTAACRLANDACNRFPSEHLVTFTPDPKVGFRYEVKDADGELVEQGRLNPNEFQMVAGKIANGEAFTDQMIQFVSKYQKVGADPSQAISALSEAESKLAGIEEAMQDVKKGDDGYEQLVEARKAALQEVKDAEKTASELARMSFPKDKQPDANDIINIKNSLTGARKAGREAPEPYAIPEAPAEPEGPGFWGGVKNALGLGGEPAPAAAPATSQGNTTAPAGEILPVPKDPATRVVGQTYRAPNGKLAIWREGGWELVNK